MTITNWPLSDRPREKLFVYGAKNLTDAELVAIFLRTGVRGKTALDIARELLQEYGSLKKLFSTEASYLFKKRGIGKAKYVMLKAAIELGRRVLREDIPQGKPLQNSRLTKQFLIHRLQDYPQEVFACLFLNSHNQVIHFEELFYGTLNEAAVYPREVVKHGLKHNAAKIILAHNHPSGNPEPSSADIEITRLLKKALALVEITIIDHIVIGNNTAISLAERGIL